VIGRHAKIAAHAVIAARAASQPTTHALTETRPSLLGNQGDCRVFVFLRFRVMISKMRLVLSVMLLAAGLAAQEPAQNRRDFTITARDHTFTPDTLEVTQDDLVKITLTSEDRPASFAIDAYRIIKRVAGHSSVTFEFRADQAGTFPFYCNLTKDPGCKEMKGILKVKNK
jgi:plastocyanin